MAGGSSKPTKRERKFKATGGIERRLKKGSVTKKGKLRKRKPLSTDKDASNKKEPVVEQRDRSDDLTANDNLGSLDLDSFFAQFAEKVEQGQVLGDDEASENDDAIDGKGIDANASDADDSDDVSKEDVAMHDEASGNSNSESSDSDSDDDDVDAAEARMKKDMAKLQEQDPEFHKFLKSNEQSLLEFGEEDGGEEVGEGDDEMDDDEGNSADAPPDAVELSAKALKSLEQGTFESHGIKSLKKLVAAYKSACHLGDASQQDNKRKPGESGKTFTIDSSQVFDQLMLLCLNRCHEAFHYHLLSNDEVTDEKKEDGGDGGETVELLDNTPVNPRTLENAKQWPTMRPIMLSFMRSTLHLMSEAKEPEQLVLILNALSKYIRMLTPFPRLAEALLKSLTALWSAPTDDEEYQLVRIKAFVRIRQLALTQPFPFIEECLKKCYLAYAKSAKFGGSSSVASELPTLTFMGNCLVELYSLDYDSSYQHAFVYIRQLALLLRAALQKKTPEAFQQVYCWQFILCSKLWVAILSAAAPQEDGALMSSLLYPLTEVILGVTRNGPSPTRHLPLRFHCIRLLQQLAAASEKYIPTTLLLMDMINQKEWHMKPKKSRSGDARGLQMNLMIRLPKEDCLRTHEQLEAAMTEIFALVQRELELYRYSAGFPEFSLQVVQTLKKFAKETRSPRWKIFARGCLDTCERYSVFATTARSKLHEAPRDIQRLECLRPASEPSMLERLNASVEKEQKQWESIKPVIKRKGKDASADKGSDDDEGSNDGETEAEKPKKKKAKRAKKPAKQASEEASPELLAQQDEVKEGIDWSDED
ncbi:hypothetical protein MPSEU_001099000 [Mayamaea pseudoterrestris]|nr:hypothetical protein MPSEU_001099000 [Mayamaea pseudoterrestris]